MAKKDQPSARDVMDQHWINYCTGIGGQEQRTAGSYWFRGLIRYYQDMGDMRFVPMRKRWNSQKGVFLSLHNAFDPLHVKLFGNPVITVPDIGVFSRYPDDICSDEELHERQRFIMLSRIREHCENVEAMSGEVLSQPDTMTQGVIAKVWPGPAKRATEKMEEYYKAYARYVDAFDLHWTDCPPVFMQKMAMAIHAKVRAFNDPEAARKRERSAARKQALKVLGIEP